MTTTDRAMAQHPTKPIIMSGESVRAILAGRKTVTRRVVKPQPPAILPAHIVHCPYQVGVTLWVRETWAIETATDSTAVMLHYAATPKPKAVGPWTFPPQPVTLIRPAQSALGDGDSAWRSPIYMPRWASRLTLEITAVRVERLQEIDYRDVLREGIGDVYKAPEQLLPAFAHHWDRINAKRGYPWASNCWVWVITFRRVQP